MCSLIIHFNELKRTDILLKKILPVHEVDYDLSMDSFIIFCKSFKDDVLRVKRLTDSISQWNADKIPFYLSVPQSDLKLFENNINFDALNSLNQGTFHLISDENIVAAMPNSTLDDYYRMRGYLNQQVVKSEAWRLLKCDNYLCIDSDAFFTTFFHLSNFLHPDGNPYSLMHQAHDFLNLAKELGKTDVLENFLSDSRKLKDEFSRIGPDYDFGPPPMIWSAKVWESLYKRHLEPKGERLWEAINRIPMEIRWYGEALIKYQAIPIHSIDPLFVFYHYEWQYKHAFKLGMVIPQQEKSLGVVIQSSWDETLRPVFAKKSFLSRTWKKFKELYA